MLQLDSYTKKMAQMSIFEATLLKKSGRASGSCRKNYAIECRIPHALNSTYE